MTPANSGLDRRTGARAGLLAAAGVLAAACAADAAITISNVVVTVGASNGTGSGTFQATLGQGFFAGDTFIYMLPAPVDILDGGDVVARITSLSTIIGPDPNRIGLSFAFVAGSSDTTFSIDSATVGFVPIVGGASASVTGTMGGTDQNGNGTSIFGDQADGTILASFYNGGTSFANLFDSPIASVLPGDSTDDADDFPGGGGFAALGGQATDMHMNWRFIVSAGDSAGGTANYAIVPSPGAAVLAGLGGIVLLSGRRRR